MRIALLSDIHGNFVALDAVLRDVSARGEVDGYWVLGDIVALGPDPVRVLERLTALPNATIIRGNTIAMSPLAIGRNRDRAIYCSKLEATAIALSIAASFMTARL